MPIFSYGPVLNPDHNQPPHQGSLLWLAVILTINIIKIVAEPTGRAWTRKHLKFAYRDNLLSFLCFQVASEVNAKILEQENQESVPQITKILKLLAWSQQQLDSKKIKYVKMTDFSTGDLQLP